MSSGDSEAIRRFWAEFRASTRCMAQNYDVVAYPDDPELATELAELILSGRRRATVSLLRDFAAGPPRPGDHVVMLDGEGAPRCVWRTTGVEVRRLDELEGAFARDEGEGDGAREGWLAMHRRHFGRQAERAGFVLRNAEKVVFERFEVVWPQADRGA